MIHYITIRRRTRLDNPSRQHQRPRSRTRDPHQKLPRLPMQTNMNFPTYVFATVNSGRATKVVEELKRNSQIDIIAPVTGRYDLVLRLKPNTPHNIYQTVKEIREISDVRTTDTHTGFDGMQPTKNLESQMALGVSILTCEHNTSTSAINNLSNT